MRFVNYVHIIHFAFTILSITQFFACQKTSNDLDEIKLICGRNFSIDRTKGFLRLLGNDGNELDVASLASLEVLEIDANGQGRSVNVSSKGCIEIPKDRIQVRANVGGSFQTAVWNPQELSGGKNELFLAKVQKPNFELKCPKGGLLAADTASFPLVAEVGERKRVSYELIARSLQDGSIHSLWKKPFGADVDFPHSIDLTKVPRGQFQLEILFSAMEKSAEGVLEYFRLESDCLLHRLDKIPSLPILSALQTKALGQDLTPPHASGSRLRFCKEKLDKIAKNIGDQTDCKPSAECELESGFSSTDRIIADAEGAYRYFFYAFDEVGQRSPVSCSNYLISAKAPKIDLKWSDPLLSKPLAVLPDLKVSISAYVKASHDLLPDAPLPLCRGYFKLATGEQIPASSVKCTSQQCEGKTLEDYVPCEGKIEMDFRQVYSRPEISRSVFVLNARADDGAGHEDASEISFWLDRSKITFQEYKASDGSEGAGRSFFLGKNEGEFFEVVNLPSGGDSSYVRILANQEITLVHQFDQTFSSLKMGTTDSSGNFFAVWASKDRDEERCIVTHFAQGSLKRTSEEIVSDCKYAQFWADPFQGLWIRISYVDDSQSLRYFSASMTREFNLTPQDFGGNDCEIEASSLIDEHVYFACWGGLYQSAASKVELKKTDINFADTKLQGDASGRLWILNESRFSNEGSTLNIGYFEDGQYFPRTNEALKAGITDMSYRLVKGVLVVDGFAWDGASNAFLKLHGTGLRFQSENEQMYTNPMGYQVSCSSKGATVHFEDGAIFWPLAGILSQALQWPVNCDDIFPVGRKRLVIKGRRNSLLILQNEDWFRLEESQYPYEEYSPIKYVRLLRGNIVVLHEKGEILEFTDNRWKRLSYDLPNEIDPLLPFDRQIIASKYLALIQDKNLWLSDDLRTWSKINLPTGLMYQYLPFFIQSSSDGTVFWMDSTKMLYSNRGGGVHEEYSMETLPQHIGSECDGNVWLLRHNDTSNGESLAIARYDSRSHGFQEVDIPTSLGSYNMLVRVQCISRDRVVLKLADSKNSKFEDFEFNLADGSFRYIRPWGDRSVLADYYWLASGNVFVSDGLIHNADYSVRSSSRLKSLGRLLTDGYFMGYVDPWDGIWLFNMHELGRISISSEEN